MKTAPPKPDFRLVIDVNLNLGLDPGATALGLAAFKLLGDTLVKTSEAIAKLIAQQAKGRDAILKAVDRVQEDVAKLRERIAEQTTKIEELQASLADGEVTPEQQAQLDALIAAQEEDQATLDALDPTRPETLPPAE